MTGPLWAAERCRYEQRQFRHLFERVDRPVPTGAEIVTAYTDGTVTLRRNRRVDGYHEAASLDGFKGVARGDFVVHGLDILRGSIGISDSDGAISAVCVTCRPRGGVEPRYFAYALRAQAWSGYTRAFARGVREGGADFRRWGTLGDLRLPEPPTGVQRAIADFLDAETARLDALIERKRRLVLVLHERLSIQISSLTRTDAMVDDRAREAAHGAGWRRLRLRRCFSSMEYGIGDVAEPAGRYPVLGMGNIDGGRVVGEPGGYVTDVDPRLLLEPGDLLFNRTNSMALVGKVALFDGEGRSTTFASYLVRLRTTALADAVYLNYALNAPELLALARSNALPSIGQANLNPSRYASMSILLPPLSEQRKIIAELDNQRQMIDSVVSGLNRQIDLLTEHRQALIAAAVTGELDVSKAAA